VAWELRDLCKRGQMESVFRLGRARIIDAYNYELDGLPYLYYLVIAC